MLLNSSEKKSAIVITRFPYESQWGGEESHTIQIARHMSLQGYEVVFMGSCEVLLKKMKDEGFHTMKVWGGKMIVTWWELLRSLVLFPFIIINLRRAYNQLSTTYDIKALYCLSLNEKLFLSPLAVSQSVPVTWVEHQEIRGWLMKSPWKYLYCKNSKSVQIVPISKNNEEALLSFGISSGCLTEIVNGVDVSGIQSVQVQKEKGLIVYANRLIKKKGVLDFIESLEYLPQKSEKKIVIIGNGKLESEVKKKMNTCVGYFSIEHLNYLKKENWYSLLRKAEVFVCSSEDSNETFSLNSAEALAAGCKLVVTKPCGIVSYLEDRKDAVFADAQNSVNLSHKILIALESEELSENGKKTAREKFNLPIMLKLYESLILRSS